MGLENPTHWIPIVVILLLLFGAKRLPEIGRSLGSGMREFKQSITGQGEPEKPSLAQGQQPAAAPQIPVAAAAPGEPVAVASAAAQAPAPAPAAPEPTQQV
jgi:sec-independent protein translocase protein TatA